MTIMAFTFMTFLVYGLLHTRSYTILGIMVGLIVMSSLTYDVDLGSAYILLDFGITTILLSLDKVGIWLIFITMICGSILLLSTVLKHSLTLYTDILILYIVVCSVLFFMAGDVVVIYFMFELISIPILLYVGLLGYSSRRTYALSLMLIVLLISSCTMLTILFIYSTEFIDAQPLSIAITRTALSTDSWLLTLLILLFFGSKVPLYPLYIWLPEAHVESNSEMSILLAAIVLKFSIFGIIRLSYWFEATLINSIGYLIGTLCIIGLVHSSVSSIHHLDLKKLVAYSSIVHMHLGLLGIFSNDQLGYIILVLTAVVHGIVSIGLFYCIGVASESVGTRHVSFIHAGTTLTPILSFVSLCTILLNIACPLTVAGIVEVLTLLVYSHIGSIVLIVGTVCAVWFCTLFSIILLYRAYMNDSSWYNSDTSDMTVTDASAMMITYSTLLVGILVL